MELVHMTAQYSNAVLVAVLPYVTEFAAKLDLPIQRPITTDTVRWSHPSPYKDWVEDGVVLTNHYWFALDCRGFVGGFRAPTNWFFEQEMTDESIVKYFGQDHMTTNEVVKMARDTLRKLGYKPELAHSYETPELDGPYDLHAEGRIGGHVPYCNVKWEWPKPENMNVADLNRIEIAINMDTKTLAGFTLILSRTNHLPTAPIKVDMVPELESDYQKRMKASGKMFINTNAPMRFPGRPPAKTN